MKIIIIMNNDSWPIMTADLFCSFYFLLPLQLYAVCCMSYSYRYSSLSRISNDDNDNNNDYFCLCVRCVAASWTPMTMATNKCCQVIAVEKRILKREREKKSLINYNSIYNADTNPYFISLFIILIAMQIMMIIIIIICDIYIYLCVFLFCFMFIVNRYVRVYQRCVMCVCMWQPHRHFDRSFHF